MYFPKEVAKTLKQFGLIKKRTWKDAPEFKMMTKLIQSYGVIWNKQAQKWMPRIMINGNVKYLGLFETAELAGAAYQAKACEVHGEFYRRNM